MSAVALRVVNIPSAAMLRALLHRKSPVMIHGSTSLTNPAVVQLLLRSRNNHPTSRRNKSRRYWCGVKANRNFVGAGHARDSLVLGPQSKRFAGMARSYEKPDQAAIKTSSSLQFVAPIPAAWQRISPSPAVRRTVCRARPAGGRSRKSRGSFQPSRSRFARDNCAGCILD
jgi:hypothetical protein